MQKDQFIPVALSARHVHINQDDFFKLFGSGAKLHELRPLSQPGQFAAEETVDLVGPKRVLYGVRILGPFRSNTQVEISRSDGYVLGVNPPIRISGNIKGTPGIKMIGPHGAIEIDEGVICSSRHIHMTPEDAIRYGVKDRQVVAVRFPGKRAGILEEVVIRVNPQYSTEFHLDLDEGNALGLKDGDTGILMKDFKAQVYSQLR
ncbi:MAG: phosphate propanoyltransferase [Candidatus Hodarchaeales archaeon]